jgi:ribA/ribD-fused uncharacterized protein
MQIIKFWGADNPNGFLSNFYPSPFTSYGLRYPTVEHYFQSKKFEGTRFEYYILSLETPKETAREGKRRDLPLRSDWEQVKEEVMFQALREKFLSDKKLLNALIDTGNAKLVENSPYDYYWGVGRNGTGKNRLGELIMMLREVLAND